MTSRFLIAVIYTVSILVSFSVFAKEQVLTIETRQGVNQTFLLVEPSGPPIVALVMLSGGTGSTRIKSVDGKVTLSENGFLQRTRNQFATNGIAVAIVDVPSDQKELWRGFRMTENHARDIEGVINKLKEIHKDIPVYLIGISRGSLSVAFIAKYLKEKVTGIVAMSVLSKDSRGQSLEFFNWSQLKQRILIVSHKNDGCRNTLYSEAASVAKEYKIPLLAVTGGYQQLEKSAARAECGPFAHHNFLGIEKPVANEIINWILQKPYKAEINE
jgi:hypothetical protein